MKLHLCSVFDSKVGAYAAPFCARSKGEAIRSFQTACSDDTLPFKRYPADYRLFVVADFDDNTGYITAVSPPEALIGADELGPPEVKESAPIDVMGALRKQR